MKRVFFLLMLAAGVSQAQYQMVQWSKIGTNDTAKMAGANWGILSKFVTFPDGSKITTAGITKQRLIDSLNAASPWLTQMTRSWHFDSTIQARQTDFPEIAVPANPATDKIRLFAVADADFTVLETLTDLGIRNRLNQDMFRIARNTTGSPIAAGQVVYFNGSTGNKPDFALAQADIEAAMPAVGVTTATVADNGFGEIMIVGRLTGVKTDYEGWTEGDPLYVSPTTPGGLTDVRPTHPNFSQWIGTVEVVHANAGVILINVQAMLGKEDGTNRNSYTIGDQGTGVKSLIFDGLADGTLSWNSATSNWGLTSGYLMLGTDTAATRAYARGIFPNNADTSKYIEDGQATASLGALVPSGTSGQMGWFKRNATAPESGTIITVTPTDTLDWQTNLLPPVPLDINATELSNNIGNVFAGIGAGRAIIALRFDDAFPFDSSFVFVNLLSRKLIAGFAVISSRIGTAGYLTTADLQTMQLNGMEMIDHSASHDTMTSPGLAYFLREVKDSKDTLESKSLWVQHFIQPGGWTGETYFNTDTKLKNRYATILKSVYPVFSAYKQNNTYLTLPARERYGITHVTGDTYTRDQLISVVDNAIATGSAVQLAFHSYLFGTAGQIDTTSFKQFLDTLVVRVNGGLVSVFTPSAAVYAKYNTPSTNYIYDEGFELSTTGNWKGWSVYTGTPIDTAAGRYGNCAEVNASNYIYQYFPTNSFRTLRFTGYAKLAYGSSGAMVDIGFEGQTRMFRWTDYTVTGAGWTKIEFTFCIPPTTLYERFYVRILATSTGWIQWDDVSVTKDGGIYTGGADYLQYKVAGTTVLDVSRNLQNINTIAANGRSTLGGGIIAAADKDTAFTFGRTKIDSRASDRVYISHYDMTGTSQYAVQQVSTGETAINSNTATDLSLRTGNTSRIIINTDVGRARITIGTSTGVGAGKLYGGDSLYIGSTLFADASRNLSVGTVTPSGTSGRQGWLTRSGGTLSAAGAATDSLSFARGLFTNSTEQFRLAYTGGTQYVPFTVTSTGEMYINPTGKGIFLGGTTTATAKLHLAAGTAAASTAPLKFTAGTPLTTPEPYVVEPSADGNYLLFTKGSGVRDTLKTGGASTTRLDSAGGWYRTGLIKTDVAGTQVMIRGTDGDTTSASLLHVGGTMDVASTAEFLATKTYFGTASSITGQVVLRHASNASTTIIKPSDGDGAVTLTTPNETGTIPVLAPAATQTFGANNVWHGTAIDTAYLIAATKYHNQAQWTITGLTDSVAAKPTRTELTILLTNYYARSDTTSVLASKGFLTNQYSPLGHTQAQSTVNYLTDSISAKPTRTELTTLLAAKQNTISNLADTSKYVEGLDSLKAAGYATRTMLQADTLYRAAQSLLRILYSDTTSTVANQWRLGYKIGVLGYSVGDTSSFTTTATRKAIYVSGARENQVWAVGPRIPANTTLPVAGDWVTICPKWDSVVVKRPAGTTSGLKFNYWRVR